MKNKLASELKRKIVHIPAVLYILVYVILKQISGHSIAMLALAGILIFYLVVEYFRVIRKKKIPIFSGFWRDTEKDKVGGEVFFTIGAIIAFAVFDYKIALCVLLMALFGDMSAALFGIGFGKHWLSNIPDRSWEGIFAEFSVDAIIGFIVLGNVLIVIPMALVATFVETVFQHMDDNLTIPLFAGFVGEVLLRLL